MIHSFRIGESTGRCLSKLGELGDFRLEPGGRERVLVLFKSGYECITFSEHGAQLFGFSALCIIIKLQFDMMMSRSRGPPRKLRRGMKLHTLGRVGERGRMPSR
jgi:hypothetical protein